jgi:hypothetical protein
VKSKFVKIREIRGKKYEIRGKNQKFVEKFVEKFAKAEKNRIFISLYHRHIS